MIRRLIGDRVYDADPLDVALVWLGSEMIAPHRRGRVRPKTQDGRPLRRCQHRWKIERTISWLGRSRRLSRDYERKVQTSETLIELAASRLALRRLASCCPH